MRPTGDSHVIIPLTLKLGPKAGATRVYCTCEWVHTYGTQAGAQRGMAEHQKLNAPAASRDFAPPVAPALRQFVPGDRVQLGKLGLHRTVISQDGASVTTEADNGKRRRCHPNALIGVTA